ncbi:MAG: S8 family serine peptidase, partial [Pauljensenia sp.]
MTMSPSLATDTDHAQVTSSEQGKPDGKSTFIVSVEEGGGDQDARLADVKTRVREAITQTQPGASVEDVAEYRHVFEGFAIKAPESALEAIKGVRGVKTAVVDTGRTPVFYPEFHRGEGEEITNPAALTRADQASFQGKGHVVEVLDMGFDATHEAFAGTMDTASLRFKQADMASVTSQLGVGRGGAWVSEKIPFAYDYADRDTDLYEEYFYGPEDFTQHAHSTRVAALAAANGATYRGAAPEAQLVVAKVVSSYSRYAFDSNLLAALDDAMVLKPDTLIVSFLANRSISGDAALLYGQAYDRLADAGTTVVAPVGDAGRSSWRADQPDGGTIGEPAANSQVLSVTALSGSGAEVGSELYPWSYSSWGVTPDLRLKPEIAAPGGEVNSAIPDRSRLYRSMEGTGEAAAQVAGIAALVRQRVDTDPAFAGMSEQEKSGVVTKLLMGTAHPVVDAREKNGIFWSPRTVGAGMVDALAATTSPVYPTVVGAANPTRPKADLGDGMRGWTFQVQLTNVSDTARTYTLGGQALSEKIEGGYFQDRAINWAGAGIDLTFSSASVTVPATSSATVTVSVTPRAEFASYAAANSPKGTFVDGVLTFTSTDGAPDLTVPYMG